jgi:hypothetical protein
MYGFQPFYPANLENRMKIVVQAKRLFVYNSLFFSFATFAIFFANLAV